MHHISPKISIVIPVHNEQDNIRPLTDRIMSVADRLRKYNFEILYVDDGSQDGTLGEIGQLIAQGLPVGYVKFSRNFGHQSALEAGITMATGDAIITMDGDLQHPPEEIPRMLDAYDKGADVVQMRRGNVADNFKGILSITFYTFFKWISPAPLVPNAADFRLISRRVADEILKIPGKGKLLRALVPSIGFDQVHLEYVQNKRKYGKPSYTFSASYELAVHTIFKFSQFPAHFTLTSGIVLLLCGFIAFVLRLFSVIPDSRCAFFIPLFVMLAGCIFIVGGILCWYLYFILEQVRHDSSYIIEKVVHPAPKTT